MANHELQILKDRLADAPDQATATFVIPHTWPDIKNAEYEVLQRISRAATNIGAIMVVTDNNGYPLWGNRSDLIDRESIVDTKAIDFMVSLHFESPRLFDVYSYYALWQPLSFYDTFGYERTSELVLSHSDALSCRSDAADAHVENLFGGTRRPSHLGDFPVLFHSPPKPYHPPGITSESKLFYVGINWERINSERGRHQDLLERLDGEDLIDIYGPRKFLGVEPWRGFKSYRGELPFDGSSVVRAVHKSGICLALSSEAHQQSALMSNRLFEGLAAGAAIIANANGFIDRYFHDLVYHIDDTATGDDLFFQVKDIVEGIRADPAEARRRATEGQLRLEEAFSLERCLSKLVSGHAERRREFDRTFHSDATVTVILVYNGARLSDVQQCLDDIAEQKSVSVSVVLVCDNAFQRLHAETLEQFAARRTTAFSVVSDRIAEQPAGRNAEMRVGTGAAVREALSRVDTDYFAFMRTDERWFRDHLSTLAKSLDASPDAFFSVSGVLNEGQNFSSNGITSVRALETVRFLDEKLSLLDDGAPEDVGRFLYRREVLKHAPTACLTLLDGQEPWLMRTAALLNGELAQSGFATFVRVSSRRAMLPLPIVSVGDQKRYIRDAVATDLTKVARGSDLKTAGDPRGVWKPRGLPLVPLGELVETKHDGNGVAYMVEGMSKPEGTFTWVDGKRLMLAFDMLNQAAHPYQDLDLTLVMGGRGSQVTGRLQHCTIVVNGITVAYAELRNEEQAFRFRLPRIVTQSEVYRVEIIADHAEQVMDASGVLSDKRHLGFRIYRFGLTPSPPIAAPRAEMEKTFFFQHEGNGEGWLNEGFFAPEDDGVWMGDGPARLRFSLEGDGIIQSISFNMLGRERRGDNAEQELTISLNGHACGVLKLPQSMLEIALALPPEMISSYRTCTITLVPKHANVVLRGEGSPDSRNLSVKLRSLRLNALHEIALGSPVKFVSGAGAERYIASGFSTAEPSFTWIDGKSGKLTFSLPKDAKQKPLILACVIGGREVSVKRSDCSVYLNSQLLGTIRVPFEKKQFEFRIPASFTAGTDALTLEYDLSHAEQVKDGMGKILDPRRLALQLYSIMLDVDDGDADEADMDDSDLNDSDVAPSLPVSESAR